MNLPTPQLPVDQWAYAVKQYTVINGNALIFPKVGSQGWRITKIQLYTLDGVDSVVSVGGPSSESSFTVTGGGCLCLEPSAYMTPFSTFNFTGVGNYVLLEYIYPVRADGVPPTILVQDT